MTNLRGEVTYVNAALCIILDEEKPENVLGKNIMDYYSHQSQHELKNKLYPQRYKRAMVRRITYPIK